MQKWIKVTLAVTVPAFVFLVLNDTVQGFYGPGRDLPLSYVVVEEEDEPAEEEAEAPAAPPETDEIAAVEAEEVAPASVATDPEPADTEIAADATPQEAEPVAADVADAGAVIVDGLTADEMQAGEAAARACASCHQLARDRNAVGPHLVGLAGRVIGSVDGFRYSQALQDLNAQGAVWDAAALEAWLENPSAFADGTRMMFQVQDPEDRRLIAGWLMQRDD